MENKHIGQSTASTNASQSAARSKNNAPTGPFGSRAPKGQHGSGQRVVGQNLDTPPGKMK